MRGPTADDLDDLKAGLNGRLEDLCASLLGKPTSRTRGEWRWGRKGSLSVTMTGPHRGRFSDFESGQKPTDALGFIRENQCGGDWKRTLEWARSFLGMGEPTGWKPQKRRTSAEVEAAKAKREAEDLADKAKRRAHALQLWREGRPVAGTIGETYLEVTRGIQRPAEGWPAWVGFHAGRCALIFAGTDDAGDVNGVQLVHLTATGQKISDEEAEGRKVHVKHSHGTLQGMPVRLPGHAGALLMAEGPETGLSVWASTGRETWIALGSLAKMDPPAGRKVVICADDDAKGAPSARGLDRARDDWRAQGRDIADAYPWTPRRFDKSDFNDLLQHAGPEAVRAQIDAVLAPPPEPHYPAPRHDRDHALLNLRREGEAFIADAIRNVAVRKEWEAIKAAIENAYDPGTRERRRALSQARKGMVAAHGKEWQAPGRRLLLPGAAGSGKTRLMAQLVAAAGEALGNVFFATDKLQNAEAVIAAIPGGMVARGRGQVDPDDGEGRLMCWRPNAAEAVARAGLPVGTTLCDDGKGRVCPFKSQCGWQREAAKMRDGTPRVIAGSHEYLAVRGAAPPPDVVVVDEAPVQALTGHASFGLDRVLPGAMPGWQRAGMDAVNRFRNIMSEVSAAIPDPAGILAGLRARGITTAEDLKPALDYLRTVEEEDFTSGITPDMDDGAVVDQLRQHQRSDIGLVLKMLSALSAEIELPRDDAHGVSFDPERPMKVDGKTERQARVFVHYRKPLSFASDRPVMILDASADPAIYRSLFGDRLEVADAVRCERNVEVVQVRDYTMVRSTLLGTDRRGNALSENSVAKAARIRAQVVDMANGLAAKHGGRFMVAANLPVEGLLSPLLEPNVLPGHYGALRGRNDYEDCTAAMILGREEPPAHAMEDVARAIFANDPEPLNLAGAYLKVKRGIRLRAGGAETVEVSVHPDARVQSVLELNRERESEQAADRLRLIHNPERKTLYVACNVPLDLTVDRTVTWKELLHEATGQIDNQRAGTGRRVFGDRLSIAWERSGGVLPLSHRELSRVFNDLWGSERAARGDSERVRTWQRDILFAKSAHFRPAVFRYRLKGQRCPSRALIGVPGDEGRRLLEALVGPLVAYDPEPPGGPDSPPPPPRPELPGDVALPDFAAVPGDAEGGSDAEPWADDDPGWDAPLALDPLGEWVMDDGPAPIPVPDDRRGRPFR